MQVWFKTSVNNETRYFAFNSKDFEQNKPVQILDIDCTGSDNVRDRFIPYSDKRNISMLQELLDLYFADEKEKVTLASKGVTTTQ